MDVKIEKLKMSSALEMNIRRFRKKRSKSGNEETVEPVESTFEINRPSENNQLVPVESSVLEIDIPEPSSSSQSAFEKEDEDLERKLKSILDEAFFC